MFLDGKVPIIEHASDFCGCDLIHVKLLSLVTYQSQLLILIVTPLSILCKIL